MQINALRKELSQLLTGCRPFRSPALRRSVRDEWLYATDIIGLLSGEEAGRLRRELAEAGWEYQQESAWLLLRKRMPEPPGTWFEGSFGPEAGCCLSLLERHTADCREDPAMVHIALIKAGEEGEKAYEALCGRIHMDWAQRLRQKQQLPDVSLKYFGA